MLKNNSKSKENVPSETIEDSNLSSTYHDNNFQDNITLNKNSTSQFENPYHIVNELEELKKIKNKKIHSRIISIRARRLFQPGYATSVILDDG